MLMGRAKRLNAAFADLFPDARVIMRHPNTVGRLWIPFPRLTVRHVKIPLTTYWLIRIDQDVMFLPKITIPILHTPRFFSIHESRQRVPILEEMFSRYNFKFKGLRFHQSAQFFIDVPRVWLLPLNTHRVIVGTQFRQVLRKTVSIFEITNLEIMNRVPVSSQ